MAQQCKDCDSIIILGKRGNGKCSSCHGRGTKNTIVNDISGSDTKCWKCKGTGTCSTCRGSGIVASTTASAPAPTVTHAEPRPVLTSDLEKGWYRLCNSSDFIPQSTVEQYTDQLKATRNHVAIAVGLSNFTGETCPKCGSRGQFKIHVLGSLRHPDCSANWYIGPGSYILYQLGQIFHTGIRAGGSMKDDADRKGDRSGGIVNAIFGFLFVAVFRAALAVVLIPLQAVVSLAQSKPTGTGGASRANAASSGISSPGNRA